MFICLNSFTIAYMFVHCSRNELVSLYRLFSGETDYCFIILLNIYMCNMRQATCLKDEVLKFQ